MPLLCCPRNTWINPTHVVSIELTGGDTEWEVVVYTPSPSVNDGWYEFPFPTEAEARAFIATFV